MAVKEMSIWKSTVGYIQARNQDFEWGWAGLDRHRQTARSPGARVGRGVSQKSYVDTQLRGNK